MFGIAICTYNRANHLDRLILEIKQKTVGDYKLIVCDDGSVDSTPDVCDRHAVTRIGDSNRGIAWNKNRGLYALHEKLKCDWTVVIEDDMAIVDMNWNEAWEKATMQYGHVNFLNDRDAENRRNRMISGIGTLADPFIATFVTGQCMFFSKECLDIVGYLNPLFQGYGSEHIDYSKRCGRAGFGMKDGGYVHLKTGLQLLGIPPTADKGSIEKNARISEELKDKDIYVAPFLDDDQKSILEREVAGVI